MLLVAQLLAGSAAGAPPETSVVAHRSSSVTAASAAQLHQAITAATALNQSATVVLPSGSVLELDRSPFTCNAPVHVSVRSDAGATIDGGGLSRIFHLSNNCTLSLRRLTLVNGFSADNGGAIFGEESGSVWLEDTEIISCRSGRSGGAISLNYMGDVSLINSTIKGCHASKRGGALHMRESGDVSLLGSRVEDSRAEINGGFLETYKSGSLHMTRSSVVKCSAKKWGGAVNSWYGGGVYVRDSSISGCKAGKAGGAIVFKEPRLHETVQLVGSTFSDNLAGINQEGAASVLLYTVSDDMLVDYAVARRAMRLSKELSKELSDYLGKSFVRASSFVNNTATFDVTILTTAPLVWQDCQLGRWMPRAGAFSGDLTGCTEACMQGYFGNSTDLGKSTCSGPCPPGHSCSEGSAEPTPCETGTYMPQAGGVSCLKCPPRLSSHEGSTTCDLCDEGFFQRNESAQVHEDSDLCEPCPEHGACPRGTTIASIRLNPGFWRDSLATSTIYACEGNLSNGHPFERSLSDPNASSSPNRCLGSVTGEGDEWDKTTGDRYCLPGHSGPKCEACEEAHFFSQEANRCQACPSASDLASTAGKRLCVALLLGILAVAMYRNPVARRWLGFVPRLGLQVKFKIVVSFCQCIVSLHTVYGVTLDPQLAFWTSALEALDFNALDMTIPSTCLGSMQARLLISALWPYAAVAALLLALAAHGLAVRRATSGVLGSALALGIFVFFLALPSVSRNIFKARQCAPYSFRDAPNGDYERSYLVADPSVRCNEGPDGAWGNDDFRQLAGYFWAFFFLWPVLVPAVFLLLTLRVRSSVRNHHMTRLAHATRFLWRDYDVSFVWWEVVDMARKLVLTSGILFVDTEYGARRLLRLQVASILSATYLALLALARPYRNSADLYLACTSNLLLTCSFVSGVGIKLCEEGQWRQTCQDFTGLPSSLAWSAAAVGLTAAMLLASLLVIGGKACAKLPSIRLASTGREPFLELPDQCHFHLFLSHAWGTGQDQTHTIARQLKLLLPQINIWLDVDSLEDISRLEESIQDSAAVLVFLSDGYFRSANCRRELYAALASAKPIIAVREVDKGKGGATVEELKAECHLHCIDESPAGYPAYRGPEESIARVFAVEPIEWVRLGAYQLETLKAITLRMLGHSRYYRHRGGHALAAGLRVANSGECPPHGFVAQHTLLVSRVNPGARLVAGEVAGASTEGGGALPVAVKEAEAADLAAGSQSLLLLLNNQTFCEDKMALASLLVRAREAGCPVVLLWEQDPDCGGCPFHIFKERTPLELQLPPHKLFDDLAVPLYRSAELRKVSLRQVLQGMGAKPLPLSQAAGHKLGASLNPCPGVSECEEQS